MKRIPAMLLRASALLLILLPAASCTDTLGDAPDTDAGAITFTPAAETRAAVDGANFLAGSSFSVWGWYGQGSDIDRNVFDDQTVTENSGAWTYEGGYQYWIAGMTYNFYGVYPSDAKAEVNAQGTVTVTGFDCSKTGAEAVDLMTAAATGLSGTAAPTVAMNFGHELAKVKFTVKSENTVATVSSFKIYGLNYQGTLTKNGTATWNNLTSCGETDTPFHLEDFTFNTTNGFEKDMLGDLLLIPHKETDLTNAKLDIAYRYQGETADRTSTIGLKTADVTQWEAGKTYHYTLTIKGGKLSITVTVNNWKEEDTSVSWG